MTAPKKTDLQLLIEDRELLTRKLAIAEGEVRMVRKCARKLMNDAPMVAEELFDIVGGRPADKNSLLLRFFERHLERINTGLGPVHSFAADTEICDDGVVRVWDDHEDALCKLEELSVALADVVAGDWDSAWDAILRCRT